MNNTEKLIASQYLVKQANLGTLLRGAGALTSGFGKQLAGMGRFVKENPFHAAAAGGLGVSVPFVMQDFMRSIAGNKPEYFNAMPESTRTIRNLVQNNSVLNKLFGTESIYAPKGPAGHYRGPQDFKPGLRAPGM